MKQFASWFTHGVPGGGALRKQIFESKSGDAVLGAIESFFANRATAADTESAVADVDETMLASAAAYCD
jgi:tRNA-dihydrouridine synthase B